MCGIESISNAYLVIFISRKLWSTTGSMKSSSQGEKPPLGGWTPINSPSHPEFSRRHVLKSREKPLDKPRETGVKWLLNVIHHHCVQKTSEPIPLHPFTNTFNGLIVGNHQKCQPCYFTSEINKAFWRLHPSPVKSNTQLSMNEPKGAVEDKPFTGGKEVM